MPLTRLTLLSQIGLCVNVYEIKQYIFGHDTFIWALHHCENCSGQRNKQTNRKKHTRHHKKKVKYNRNNRSDWISLSLARFLLVIKAKTF